MRKPIGKIKNKSEATRIKRKLAIRKKVIGTTDRPRVCVNKTNKHVVVQVIDDSTSKTIFSAQTYGKNAVSGAGGNREGGKLVGAKVAEMMKGAKLEKAVFDRNGFKFHGVISAVAEGIKENGIQL